MKKWSPSIIAALTAATAVFYAPVQAAISHHPSVAMVLAAAYAVISHLLPSPTQAPPQV